MATNIVSASYQEIIDISTKLNELSVVGIHTPTGYAPRSMLDGFWRQFKKFRYLGCSIRMVPSASLPADLAGVSLDPNEAGIDPREPVNPILFHGCHGESLSKALNVVYQNGTFDLSGTSFDVENINFADLNMIERMYYSALSDNSFRKFMPQQGVSIKRLYPLVWTLASNQQISPNGTFYANGLMSTDENGVSTPEFRLGEVFDGTLGGDGSFATNGRYVQQFTNKTARLGWIPTKGFGDDGQLLPNTMPKVFMGVLLFPPSYKTIQYFRMVITHHFQFAGFTTALSPMDAPATNIPPISYTDAMDSIHTATTASLLMETLESPNSKITPVSSGVY